MGMTWKLKVIRVAFALAMVAAALVGHLFHARV